ADESIEVQDFGRGIPVDWNNSEQCYNWELVFCELYAGGKYKDQGENYEFSLGLNGLGSCATQYASRFFDVQIVRDGFQYDLHFEKGSIVGDMKKETTTQKKTGSKQKWLPDMDVFTDISIPTDYFLDTLKKQAVVNPGILFEFFDHTEDGVKKYDFCYENGVTDYLKEEVGENSLTGIEYWEAERVGRDREDRGDYKVKFSVALTFSNRVKMTEYYHNSSFLEYGGSPERAVRQAFVSQIDAYLKQNGKYLKNENKITFADVEECLCLISSSFSTQTSYENQTKKAITNKFIYESMTEFLKHQLEIYFLENPVEANKIVEQVMVNKRSRENAEKTRLNIKKKL
ncbi:MAG: DNA topoisomerase, partial [Oscillospiraceae bacterium]